MKKLSIFLRPYFAKRVLEVGGGHNPYTGVTHSVDKFPKDNSQRAGDFVLPQQVEFLEGDLEALPFETYPKFDFVYLSHVLEHVNHPLRAIQEINRVSKQGYLETPSPLREQLITAYPFNLNLDIHKLFCWQTQERNTVCILRKTPETVGTFCQCKNGQFSEFIFKFNQDKLNELESLLPGIAKTTRIRFRTPLKLKIFDNFEQACKAHSCAYLDAGQIAKWTSFPFYLASTRFKSLKKILPS